MLAASGSAWPQSLESLLQGKTKTKAKALVVPIYQPNAPAPSAVVRVEAVFTEYQKRHFFRIGLLPLLVLDGVNVELREPRTAGAAWAQVRRQFQSLGRARAVELRRLKIVTPASEGPAARIAASAGGPAPGGLAEPGASLLAATCRPLPEGDWELSEAVWQSAGGPQQTYPRAKLQASPTGLVVREVSDVHPSGAGSSAARKSLDGLTAALSGHKSPPPTRPSPAHPLPAPGQPGKAGREDSISERSSSPTAHPIPP